MSSGSPSLSVVVTAHDRREFLLEAVRSLGSGKGAPPGLEVIVVKNFEDPGLEAQLQALGARSLLSTSRGVGGKLAEGVRASHGEVLAFLEDDDLYEPAKLGALSEAFARDPDLAYLHHDLRVIDRQGRPLPDRSYRGTEIRGWERIGSLRVAAGDRERWLRSLALDPYFNASSIAVRRRVLLPRLSVLAQVELVPDCFLFFASLLSGGTLGFDGRRLTRYRVHGANASQATAQDREAFLDQMKAWSDRIAPSLALIEGMVAAETQGSELRAIQGARAAQQVYAVLRDRHGSRSDMRSALTRFQGLRDTYSWKSHRNAARLGRLYGISPGIARWLYVRRKASDLAPGEGG